MTQPAKSQEPSMEEILASIRRIIADDDIPKAAAAQVPEPAAPPAPPAPVVNMSRPEPIPEPPAIRPAPMAAKPAPQPEPEPVRLEPEPADDTHDILELTEEMRAPHTMATGFRTISPEADVMFTDPVPQLNTEPLRASFADEPPAIMPQHLEEARQVLAEQMDSPLLSNTTSAVVDQAFASLAHTVLSQNARTLDDLVKDMLRPMLKSWLDDNLPSLVERLVRAEIERVSRGR
jgi:uncharacterized protein